MLELVTLLSEKFENLGNLLSSNDTLFTCELNLVNKKLIGLIKKSKINLNPVYL